MGIHVGEKLFCDVLHDVARHSGIRTKPLATNGAFELTLDEFFHIFLPSIDCLSPTAVEDLCSERLRAAGWDQSDRKMRVAYDDPHAKDPYSPKTFLGEKDFQDDR